MAEVFISYSQKDRALVAPIAARLAELGVDAWYDREISAGQSFGAIIRAKLKEAKAILVCWSAEAIDSQWVDAEADFAREIGTYVPVFVAPCALMPPFNRIHTDDLSKWTGAADDPIWIKLIDRIAHLIGRAGVAAAARALATEDERVRYDFARRHPDEPVARKIWVVAEARHRQEFEKRLADARAAAASKLKASRAALDARLAAAAPAFEAWLADERRGVAKGPAPDPVGIVEPADADEAEHLRGEVVALSEALSRTKGRDGELSAARGEIQKLTGELAAERAARAAQEAALSDALARAKAREEEFDAAREEIERLTGKLAAERHSSTARIAALSGASPRANTREDESVGAREEIGRLSGLLTAEQDASVPGVAALSAQAKRGEDELDLAREEIGRPKPQSNAAPVKPAAPAISSNELLARVLAVAGAIGILAFGVYEINVARERTLKCKAEYETAVRSGTVDMDEPSYLLSCHP
jgi:hypothetical protein